MSTVDIVGEPMIFRWYGMLIVSEWLDCLLGSFAMWEKVCRHL